MKQELNNLEEGDYVKNTVTSERKEVSKINDGIIKYENGNWTDSVELARSIRKGNLTVVKEGEE